MPNFFPFFRSLSCFAGVLAISGCALNPATVGSGDQQSAAAYEFSSFSRERGAIKSAPSLVDALAANLSQPSLVGALASKPTPGQCRTEPVFLRYHLQSVFDRLNAGELNESNVALRKEQEFIVMDIPIMAAQHRPHQAFSERLEQLAEVVRQEQNVGVFVAQYGDHGMRVRWGDQDVTQQRVRQVLLSHGVEPHRVADLTVENETAKAGQPHLRVKLCYR